MVDLNTYAKWNIILPTNMNGLVNTVSHILTWNKKEHDIEHIKDYFRSVKAMDFHVFFKPAMKTEYWLRICCRIMKIYSVYLNDVLVHFGFDNIGVTESDLSYSLGRLFGRKYYRDKRDLRQEYVYDHDYLSKYVADSENDYLFDIYAALAADKLQEFIPNIYGGKRLKPFSSVENMAHTPFIMTDKLLYCVSELWAGNSKETRNFIRETMGFYFSEESINNFLKYMKDHGKAPQEYNKCKFIYYIKFNNNYIFNSNYTLTEPLSKMELYKEYFREFIEYNYRCA